VLGFRGGVSEATDEIWGFAALVGGGEGGEDAEGAGGWIAWYCRGEQWLSSSLMCADRCDSRKTKRINEVTVLPLIPSTAVPCMMEFWLVGGWFRWGAG
jgi:hypothetical protein